MVQVLGEDNDFLEPEQCIKFVISTEAVFTSQDRGLPKLSKNCYKCFFINIQNDILTDFFIMTKGCWKIIFKENGGIDNSDYYKTPTYLITKLFSIGLQIS